MTEWRNTTVSCPACCEEGNFRICTKIDIGQNPELLNSLYSRDIFKFTCPECGEEIIVAYDCTLISKADKYAVSLIVDGDDSTDTATLTVDGFKLRIVRSINALVEKVALFEDDIDDKVIELYKIMLEDQFEEEKPDAELLGIYYGGSNAEDNTLLFYIITANAENTRATLSTDTYYAIEKQLGEQADTFKNDTEIDRTWALKVLSRWGEKSN